MPTNDTQMTEFFDKASEGDKVPFSIEEMADAVQTAAFNGGNVLDLLAESMIGCWVRTNPGKPARDMQINAFQTLATLAYKADCDPSEQEWLHEGPQNAYSQSDRYGTTMTSVKKIVEQRGLSLFPDVFPDTTSIVDY